jgi:signal transduction histidine kinase
MVLDTNSIEAQNLAELSQFAEFGRLSAGLLHDLATPLNIVLLNLEELKAQSLGMDADAYAELQTAINRAFDGTQRMVRFLQLARQHIQQKKVLSEFGLVQEIEQAVSLFQSTSISKSIKIEINKQHDIKYFGNSTQFFQVIMNLISNALDAYPPGIRAKKVVISIAEEQTEILITVKDWGSGISEEDQSQIFEPLFTTKSGEQGTGIGLYVSREIIEAHFRGNLEFVSELGSGSTFTIHLPRRTALRVSE